MVCKDVICSRMACFCRLCMYRCRSQSNGMVVSRLCVKMSFAVDIMPCKIPCIWVLILPRLGAAPSISAFDAGCHCAMQDDMRVRAAALVLERITLYLNVRFQHPLSPATVVHDKRACACHSFRNHMMCYDSQTSSGFEQYCACTCQFCHDHISHGLFSIFLFSLLSVINCNKSLRRCCFCRECMHCW